ncbi:hypothetical protein NKH18_01280 [Streptomyces sp. M10(2022)]
MARRRHRPLPHRRRISPRPSRPHRRHHRHHHPDDPYVRDYGNGNKSLPEECINLTLLAQCQGCPEHDLSEHDGLFATVMNRVLESPYGSSAREWAQSHAETCRAIPKPTA